MNTPGFLYYCADFIELIHTLKSYFNNNHYITEDEEVSQILYYLNINTIPNNLYSQVPLSDIWTTMGNHPTIFYEQDKSVLLKQLYTNPVPACFHFFKKTKKEPTKSRTLPRRSALQEIILHVVNSTSVSRIIQL